MCAWGVVWENVAMSSAAPYVAGSRPSRLYPRLYPRLVRRRDEAMCAGVAAGIARHLGLDATLIRVLFVLGAAFGGNGALLYLVLWGLTPVEGRRSAAKRASLRKAALWVLVFAGVGILLWAAGDNPVLVVVCGAALALRAYDQATFRPGTVVLLLLGALLVLVGVLSGVVVLNPKLHQVGVVGDVVIAVLGALAGVGLLVVPVMVRMASSVVHEREEKAVASQRAEMAAHLHDSVLQTLALIQKSADHAEEVARLARGQERELRAWLFDPEKKAEAARSVFGALQEAAGEVEDKCSVVIQPVTVGEDLALDKRNRLLILAAREAMFNAAKHAGVGAVDVYAEHFGGELSVFVRDRGCGFDLEAVPADRHGVRDSIVARMQRAGGVASVRSQPGEGTEVALTLPPGDAQEG